MRLRIAQIINYFGSITSIACLRRGTKIRIWSHIGRFYQVFAHAKMVLALREQISEKDCI